MFHKLTVEIRKSEFVFLIANETDARDANNLEQLCVSIKWFEESYQIDFKDIIGMVEVQEIDALTISNAQKDVLIHGSLMF